ncbi:MAG: hypothetical protein WCS73_11580, partial [Lentisphaeria bacterium]
MLYKKLDKESGSALLLTLGVLSLALVMAMAFAFSSRSDRKIAEVNADSVKSKLLAESYENHAVAVLQYFIDNPSLASWTWTPVDNEKFRQKHFKFSVSGDDSFKTILEDSSNQYLNKVAELEFADDVKFFTVTDDSSKITGQYGFLILDESGKINLNEAMDLRYKEKQHVPYLDKDENRAYAGSSINYNYQILNNIINSDTTFTEEESSDIVRRGSHPYELSVPEKFYSTVAGPTTGPYQWVSYEHIYNTLADLGASEEMTETEAMLYTFYGSEVSESYYDGTPGSGTKYARFDLTGTEMVINKVPTVTPTEYWNSITIADLTASSPKVFDEEDTTHSIATCIPYLNGKEQIAANLIDYCDEDDYATKDDASFEFPDNEAELSSSVTAYFGNEKHPYINKILLEARVDQPVSVGSSHLIVRLIPTVQFLNIFDDDLPSGNTYLNVKG